MTRITLPQVTERLQAHYGKQQSPKLDAPWEMILWENVAYLADDDRRLQAAGERLNMDCPWLIEAHLLLRRHGQELCRRSELLCGQCPLAGNCEMNLQR